MWSIFTKAVLLEQVTSAPEKMASLELTAASARALIQAGRLRELIGVASDASPEEVKAACKRALLTHHPDKGGDPEVFKVIQPALQQEEQFYAFEGGAPHWAKELLAKIAGYRRELDEATQELHAAKTKAESATDRGRAKAMADVAQKERGIENTNVDLSDALKEFKACYAQHLDNEQQRKEEEKREAAARERLRLQLAREDHAIWKRRQRGTGKRFPTLPKANTNKAAIDPLMTLRREYQSVRQASLKCKRQGGDTSELESRAAIVMQKAREHVQHWCRLAHEEAGDRLKRFPCLPPGWEAGKPFQPIACLLMRQATPMLYVLARFLHDNGCSGLQLTGISALSLAFQRCLAHGLVFAAQGHERVNCCFVRVGLGQRWEAFASAPLPSLPYRMILPGQLEPKPFPGGRLSLLLLLALLLVVKVLSIACFEFLQCVA